ncbi:hypothetical protein EZJ49_03830 [Bdellovibrio bacteriovorus]|uniref:hypothetical protein n=1 Tax=Bdellovibrio bacteriovorus TaxID=959 RepID=UPI0021D09A49|nr:hypothetical protein [Bdellovibrio bacteriovorus]UXR65381.1 hypothetical protein EZJ49_03830 [Bdellovibrio bacteriovorus]
MKLLQLLTISTLLVAGTSQVLASGIESSIQGFELKTCSAQNLCLVARAASSQGSQLKALHILSKPLVEISTKDASKPHEVIQADSGYLDFSENQLVLYKRHGAELEEISIKMADMEIKRRMQGDL